MSEDVGLCRRKSIQLQTNLNIVIHLHNKCFEQMYDRVDGALVNIPNQTQLNNVTPIEIASLVIKILLLCTSGQRIYSTPRFPRSIQSIEAAY